MLTNVELYSGEGDWEGMTSDASLKIPRSRNNNSFSDILNTIAAL